MKYMDMEIDQSKLPTMEEVAAQLNEGGGDYHALSAIRDQEWDVFGHELTWRYPITDGASLGAFIVPVQEGFLWIPYDEVDKAQGEQLLIKDAQLLTADFCTILADDIKSYMNGLASALSDMEKLLNNQQNNDDMEDAT